VTPGRRLAEEADPQGRAGEHVDPVEYLRGDWHVERSIVDLRTGGRGQFRGVVRCTPGPGGRLVLDEEGELVWRAHRGPARRVLELRRVSRGHAEVLFDDGRPFHALELRRDGFLAHHVCGDDRYDGRFLLHGPSRWSVAWQAVGPSKCLWLDACYERMLT